MSEIHGAAPQTPFPTWAGLVNAEPRLNSLLLEANAVDGSSARFCANSVWYGTGRSYGLKGRLIKLVGWDRPGRHPFLNGDLAYRVAYQTIYAELPSCRDCFCIRSQIQ